MVTIKDNNGFIELHYDKYVKRGSLMQLREALPLRDPDNLYNYISANLEEGYNPEDFGIFHPVVKEFQDKSKEELLNVITEVLLENERLRHLETLI